MGSAERQAGVQHQEDHRKVFRVPLRRGSGALPDVRPRRRRSRRGGNQQPRTDSAASTTTSTSTRRRSSRSVGGGTTSRSASPLALPLSPVAAFPPVVQGAYSAAAPCSASGCLCTRSAAFFRSCAVSAGTEVLQVVLL